MQLRRPDLGTALLDPIPLGDLSVLDPPLADSEWVLHAANQDLPCLAEVGIRPRRLFDTELAGRLAGLPRVGLGPLVEQMLGLSPAQGHGAADWSTRPLPHDWLVYAALDVEVLVELRDAMEAVLIRQGKLEWAHQEFAAIVAAPPAPPRVDPWRRTSGMHRITDRRALAVIRELWTTRDSVARRRDVAPHRILPDSAIVAAATAKPTTIAALTALPVFSGRMQRRNADLWLAADRPGAGAARRRPARRPAGRRRSAAAGQMGLPGPGGRCPAAGGPDRPGRAVRAGRHPGREPAVARFGPPGAVDPAGRTPAWTPSPPRLADRGARPWQIELTAPVLHAALGHTA